VKELNYNHKLIAAICAAPWILAKAGILEDRNFTTSIVQWQEMHREILGSDDPFPRKGFVNERVVRDGNIITAKGVAFIDFAVEVCDYFGLFKDEAERLAFEKDLKG
jgi:putative intracellular protease/amidase